MGHQINKCGCGVMLESIVNITNGECDYCIETVKEVNEWVEEVKARKNPTEGMNGDSIWSNRFKD